MKKKLTVNTLAVGNLKQHKKQYAVMLCGIVLAMVFSSSVVFAIFSMIATNREFSKQSMGNQDFILSHTDEETMHDAAEKGLVAQYGFAHTVAYAYADSDEYDNGVSIAWLDDAAKSISYISFLEGNYPENENEIAIEKIALLRLGIDAKVGDTVTLSVLTQNDRSYIGDAQEKTYKLVGIVRDKRANMSWSINDQQIDAIPAAFVCQGTQIAAGGKENLIAYGRYKPADVYSYHWKDFEAFTEYLTQKGENTSDLLIVNRTYYYSSSQSLSKLTDNITLACVLGIVLMAASCLMIIGAFNTNLRERRKQIGLLRAVGTTRQQIITIFGREAFLIALLCTPVSAALSYGIVMILGHFLGGDFVPASVGWIALSVAVSVVTVMLASLIPLVSASKITPMQAIRNIDYSRKMKKHRIQSQSEFDVPKLLAKRNLTFYKGSRIAVTVMLIVTIVFSCVGFSVMKQLRLETIENTTTDYFLHTMNMATYSAYANIEKNKTGLTETEKREIEAAPYVKNVTGQKSCHVNLLTDKITDFMRVMDYTIYNGFYEDEDGLTQENFLEKARSTFSEEYLNIKSTYGYTSELYPMTMNAVDDAFLSALQGHLTAGKINLEKLAAGEEVILVAPKKAALSVEVYTESGGYSYRVFRDEQIENNSQKNTVLTATCDYKVGDTVTLSTLNADSMDEEDGYELKNVTRNDRSVTIGAIISPDLLEGFGLFGFYENFYLLTSVRGIERFSENEKYKDMFLNADREITPEIDDSITAMLDLYAAKYAGNVTSVYGSQQESQQNYRSLFIAMLALIILDFAICASIVNNSLTARIRESKKEIGTLRAVGVSELDLVNSYVRQLLSMFVWGYGIGFALFLVIFFGSKLMMKKLDMGILMIFSPWATILFCVLLFALCSLNLWVRIRREMKNSIVENIREL